MNIVILAWVCNDLNQSACVLLLNTAGASCVGESCSTHRKDKETATEEESSKTGDPSVGGEGEDEEKDGQPRSGGTGKERATEDEKGGERGKRSEEERASPESIPHIQPGSPQPLEGMDDSSIP